MYPLLFFYLSTKCQHFLYFDHLSPVLHLGLKLNASLRQRAGQTAYKIYMRSLSDNETVFHRENEQIKKCKILAEEKPRLSLYFFGLGNFPSAQIPFLFLVKQLQYPLCSQWNILACQCWETGIPVLSLQPVHHNLLADFQTTNRIPFVSGN